MLRTSAPLKGALYGSGLIECGFREAIAWNVARLIARRSCPSPRARSFGQEARALIQPRVGNLRVRMSQQPRVSGLPCRPLREGGLVREPSFCGGLCRASSPVLPAHMTAFLCPSANARTRCRVTYAERLANRFRITSRWSRRVTAGHFRCRSSARPSSAAQLIVIRDSDRYGALWNLSGTPKRRR